MLSKRGRAKWGVEVTTCEFMVADIWSSLFVSTGVNQLGGLRIVRAKHEIPQWLLCRQVPHGLKQGEAPAFPVDNELTCGKRHGATYAVATRPDGEADELEPCEQAVLEVQFGVRELPGRPAPESARRILITTSMASSLGKRCDRRGYACPRGRSSGGRPMRCQSQCCRVLRSTSIGSAAANRYRPSR